MTICALWELQRGKWDRARRVGGVRRHDKVPCSSRAKAHAGRLPRFELPYPLPLDQAKRLLRVVKRCEYLLRHRELTSLRYHWMEFCSRTHF